MYTLNVSNLNQKFHYNQCGGEWQNLTLGHVLKNDSLIIKEYENLDIKDEKIDSIKEKRKKAEEIINSDYYLYIEKNYCPMVTFVHVLQNEVWEEDIKKIFENTSDIIIIKDDEDNFYLSLSAYGMDLSGQLAYAYMVIDVCIPPGLNIISKNSKPYGLTELAHKELLEFLEVV